MKLEVLTGKNIGRLTVLKRGPDHDGCILRVQWWCECFVCKDKVLVIARDLKRYSQRFEKGCYKCSKFNTKPKNRFKYGKNINGFIDKTIIIED